MCCLVFQAAGAVFQGSPGLITGSGSGAGATAPCARRGKVGCRPINADIDSESEDGDDNSQPC